jgi:hypothetical protein
LTSLLPDLPEPGDRAFHPGCGVGYYTARELTPELVAAPSITKNEGIIGEGVELASPTTQITGKKR